MSLQRIQRKYSQVKFTQLSKDNPLSNLEAKKRLRIQSMDNSPKHSSSKIEQHGFLPPILPTASTLPQSTKSKQSKIESSQFISNTQTEPVRMKRKSKSTYNIHEQVPDQSSVVTTEQSIQQHLPKVKSGQKLPLIYQKKNLSYINMSNASTLNFSYNNSKQDLSMMLVDFQNRDAIKNQNTNNSYLSSSAIKSLNSSRLYGNNLKKKIEDPYANFDSELKKLINVYNNNTTNASQTTIPLESAMIEQVKGDITFEEDHLFQNDSQAETQNEPPKSSQQKREKKNLQKMHMNLKFMDALHLEYKMLLSEINGDVKKDNLFNILNSIIELCEKSSGNSEFTIKNYNLFAEVCRDIGDYNKSISLLHHARLISSMIPKYNVKLQLYKKVSDILSQSGQYHKALVYLKKMLRLAWKLRDEDNEIESYDLIGKQLMLIGEVDLADFFHQKSMDNDKEPINSPLRVSGEIGVKIRNSNLLNNDASNYKSDSDDDLDLSSFPKSKQDDNIRRNEMLKKYSTIQHKPSQNFNHNTNDNLFNINSQRFSVPQMLNSVSKRYQSLGRINIPSYLREELEVKVSQRLSHLSQNRDLKNFYVYTYKNQNFWIKDGDFNQQQRFYVLKKNYPKHRFNVNKLVQDLIALQHLAVNEIKNNIENENNKILNPQFLQ